MRCVDDMERVAFRNSPECHVNALELPTLVLSSLSLGLFVNVRMIVRMTSSLVRNFEYCFQHRVSDVKGKDSCNLIES